MKRFITLLLATVIASSCTAEQTQERSLVIISTNDMHSQIVHFPLLATAIKECRDTADVILVDAGDRWTGSAYVDIVEHYAPMYELMNYLGFDISALGNHEFDKGQAYLAMAEKQAEFTSLCANIISDTMSFPPIPAEQTITRGGIAVQFVGVVGNWDNGHPAGKAESYEGVRFIDPYVAASQIEPIKSEEPYLMVLLSHMGLDYDITFAQSELSSNYNLIIGGHSHDVASQVVNNKLIGQSGSRLKMVGATTVRVGSDSEIKLSYKNIPLSDYAPDPEVEAMVEAYMDNPTLKREIAQASAPFNKEGVANLLLEVIRSSSGADVALYNRGGVRIDTIMQGAISYGTLFEIDPFDSQVVTLVMTPEQMRTLIMSKFNDTLNLSEAKSIDILSTAKYSIITDPSGKAVDINFSELRDGVPYKVVMGSYMFGNYRDLDYSNGYLRDALITTLLEAHLTSSGRVTPNNRPRQKIE